jgi:parallel beta-helix repeat protein
MAFALAAPPPVVAASVLNVPGTYATIQAAINAAVNGDTVMVAPGTYFENIDFKGKLITVQSAQGPSVTTIDGGGVAPVVSFNTGETTAAVLRGFTIQHGTSTPTLANRGAGVHIGYATSPTIIGNVITANSVCGTGMGVGVDNGSPVIRDNTITGNTQGAGCSGGLGGGIGVVGAGSAQIIHNTINNNTADSGAGIALFAAGTPTLLDNTISNNSGNAQGGGLYIVNQSDATIVENLITGNSDYQAGGIYLTTPSGTRGPVFVNNTLAGNTATDTEVFLGGFDSQVALYNNIVAASATQPAVVCDTSYTPTSPVFDHNDVFNSAGSAATGSCANFAAGGGNISADPQFAAAGDYHPKFGSPVIDAGNNSAPSLPSTDLDGKPRISGPAVDVGVYEFQHLAVTGAALPGAVEGTTFSAIVASFNGGVAPYSASIAWGDGQSSPGTIASGNSVSGSHAYAEEGGYTVTVTVTDSTGTAASATTPASASDAAISLSGTRLTVHHKTNFTLRVATLTDADPSGTASDYTGQISWGDGTVSTCPSAACAITASGSAFAVNGSHNYAHSHTYTVTITLTDAGGSTATTMTTIQAT